MLLPFPHTLGQNIVTNAVMQQVENAFQLTRLHVANVTAAEFRGVYEPLHEPLVIDVSEFSCRVRTGGVLNTPTTGSEKTIFFLHFSSWTLVFYPITPRC